MVPHSTGTYAAYTANEAPSTGNEHAASALNETTGTSTLAVSRSGPMGVVMSTDKFEATTVDRVFELLSDAAHAKFLPHAEQIIDSKSSSDAIPVPADATSYYLHEQYTGMHTSSPMVRLLSPITITVLPSDIVTCFGMVGKHYFMVRMGGHSFEHYTSFSRAPMAASVPYEHECSGP